MFNPPDNMHLLTERSLERHKHTDLGGSKNMSTAKAAIIESMAKPRLRGLPGPRKAQATERLEKIKEMAAALLDEAESLDHEHALAESSDHINSNLTHKTAVDFFDEVRRFEMRLISRALELTGGNQARAARLLGLGTTTLNYKIKTYQLI
jgi:DNA-binding NtrC family response regulator